MAFDLSKAGFGIKSNPRVESIVKIPLEHVHENEKNFYGIRDIEALAESIRASGLLDPIVVTQEGPQDYRIISGHRRYHAYDILWEESPEYAEIPARVVSQMDDPSEVLALIGANATQRELTYDEKLRQEAACREALEAMKAAGKDVPRRLGDFIAEQLGTSRNEVSRMHSVNTNLIPEAREKVAAGEMNASEAYQLSRKEPEVQRQIVLTPVKPEPEPVNNPVQESVNQRIEENRQEYADKYQQEMQLLDTALQGHMDLFLEPDIINAPNRNSAVGELKQAWKNRYCLYNNGYSFEGSGSGVRIINETSNVSATISYYDLYDHLCLAAMKRLQEVEDAPAPEPVVVHEKILSGGWQTGSPEAEGEYVCIFDMGVSSTKRVCEWKQESGKYAWYFLHGAAINSACVAWVKLPEVENGQI